MEPLPLTQLFPVWSVLNNIQLLYSQACHPESNRAPKKAELMIEVSLCKLMCQYNKISKSHLRKALFQTVHHYRVMPMSVTQITTAEVVSISPPPQLNCQCFGQKTKLQDGSQSPTEKHIKIGEHISVRNQGQVAAWHCP